MVTVSLRQCSPENMLSSNGAVFELSIIIYRHLYLHFTLNKISYIQCIRPCSIKRNKKKETNIIYTLYTAKCDMILPFRPQRMRSIMKLTKRHFSAGAYSCINESDINIFMFNLIKAIKLT